MAILGIEGNVTSGSALSGCGSPRDLTNDAGVILSHADAGQSKYNASECVWVIKPSVGTEISLSFDTFQLEDSDNCQFDYLKVSGDKTTPIAIRIV